MKNIKLNITILLLFFSLFSFSQDKLECKEFHPNMTHAEWLEVINYEENTEYSSWKHYKTDWKENTTICSEFFDQEAREEVYGLYMHQAKIKIQGGTKEYTVNDHCDIHRTTGEIKYDKPLNWYQKWPNKPFSDENDVNSCLTVSVMATFSNKTRNETKYDWKDFIADLDNTENKEDNLNLYSHQSIDPWYKGWPRKKY
jgi:hypothetical protein